MSPRMSTGNSEAEETDDTSSESFTRTIPHVEDIVDSGAIVTVEDQDLLNLEERDL